MTLREATKNALCLTKAVNKSFKVVRHYKDLGSYYCYPYDNKLGAGWQTIARTEPKGVVNVN